MTANLPILYLSRDVGNFDQKFTKSSHLTSRITFFTIPESMYTDNFLKTALSMAFACSLVVYGAELKPVPKFGYNPSNLTMNIYVPDKLAANPPVVVAVRKG